MAQADAEVVHQPPKAPLSTVNSSDILAFKPLKEERGIGSNFGMKDQFWENMNSSGTKHKDEGR